MNSLSAELDRQIGIYEHSNGWKENCSLVVMSPATWDEMINEVFSNSKSHLTTILPKLTYKGIKVMRSSDIEKDLFELR